MKKLLSLFLLLVPCLAWAQYPSNGNQKITLGEQTTADGLIWRGVASIDTVTATSKITRANKQDTSAFLLLDTTTNLLWHYKTASNGWSQAGGSTFDTTTLNLTSRFATKLNISDTASMLIPYFRDADTTTLNLTSRFATKLNISDTASMLIPYFRDADTSSLNLTTRFATKLNISDTASMLIPYFRDADTSSLNLTTRFAAKQNTLTLTTTGTSGASTLTGATLNIPQYSGGGVDSTAIKYVNTYGTQTVNGIKTFGYNTFETIGTSYTLYYQTSPNVSHGVTGWLPTNAYSWQGPEDTNNGGFSFVAATDAATPGALNFYGIMGSTTPTSNAINFRVGKKNGTSIQALGAAENAMVFNNYGSTDLLQFKGNGDAAFGKFIGGGTSGLSIDNTGTLVRTSSYELKKDITPIHYGLNEILLLNPINFNWVNSDKYGDNNENGFIAEDVLSIIPNSVNTNGESIFMDYSKLIPILTKAIQEQQALIKALEQRIINLENK